MIKLTDTLFNSLILSMIFLVLAVIVGIIINDYYMVLVGFIGMGILIFIAHKAEMPDLVEKIPDGSEFKIWVESKND